MASQVFTAQANTRERENEAQAESLVQSWFQQGGRGVSLARLHFLGQERLGAAQIQRYANDPRAEVRQVVAEGLAELCVAETERALLGLLDDPDPPVRMTAARALGCIHSVAAAQPLRKRLTDPASGVRVAAARALGGLHQRRDGAALMKTAQVEGDAEVRSVLVEAIGETGDRRQTAFLKSLLKSPSELTRVAAARALCRLNDPAGFQFARTQLAALELSDRRQAIKLLEGTALSSSRPLLQPLLEDADPAIRALAATALHRSGDTSMLAWLVKAAHTARPEDKRLYEDQLEALDVTDAQRAAILKSSGLQ